MHATLRLCTLRIAIELATDGELVMTKSNFYHDVD